MRGTIDLLHAPLLKSPREAYPHHEHTVHHPLLSLTTTSAAAAADGAAHLAAVDKKANAPTDTWFKFSATTQEAGKGSSR